MTDGLAIPPNRERAMLAFIIGSAFAGRAFAIWISRPEFIGWFNHSYYYWLQVQGVLESGQLPYADMPLLFYFYAAEASVLQLFGLDMQAAIVISARVTMSIAPALIAYPIYMIVRRIGGFRSLSSGQCILVALSAFLPLTFAHMPELLQKNTLGLLLLSGLMYATYSLVHSRSPRFLIAVSLLFILITLTHVGTLAVGLLFGLSLLLAVIYNKADSKQVMAILVLVAAFSVVGLAAVYVLDPEALGRILGYAQSSLSHSLLGSVFSSEPISRKLVYLLGVLIPLALVFFLVRTYKQHRESLQPADRIFWLGNVLLPYLLVLPVFDLDVVPRLVLFMPLPLLIVLSYQLQYKERKRPTRLLVGLASVGIALMLVGETMNLIKLYPDKEEIHEELLGLRERYQLSENDFVLTTYAVNPICNWFLGTKSGLITAFNESDRESYDRLFVLNPSEGRPATAPADQSDSDRITFRTAQEKYAAMRQRVPLLPEMKPLATSDHLEFHELHAMPEHWLFNAEGDWIGYRVRKD